MVIEIQIVPSIAPWPATSLTVLAEEALAFAANNRAASTKRAYLSDWSHFERWVHQRDLTALPADPLTVSMYIADMASQLRVSTIARRLAAISVVHQAHGLLSPTSHVAVREVMKGIRRTIGVAQREAAPATIGDVRAMVAHAESTLRGRRDRALVLVGFAGAFRRSELVSLDLEDVERRDEGVAVLLRRSKNDQEGCGRRVAIPFGSDRRTCPVRALDEWTSASGIVTGALFRPIDRHGRVSAERLSGQAVALVVKRLALDAGLDASKYSGHSLRAGFATSAAAAGASEGSIARQTGQRSMEVLRRYIRHGSEFVDNAVSRVGL